MIEGIIIGLILIIIIFSGLWWRLVVGVGNLLEFAGNLLRVLAVVCVLIGVGLYFLGATKILLEMSSFQYVISSLSGG